MTDVFGWLPLALALLLVAGWYLSYSAGRLDRLHHRVESTRAALDAQLVRRAAATFDVTQALDPATGLLLTDAAAGALVAGELNGHAESGGSVEPVGSPARLVAVEEAENDLTRALQAAFGDPAEVAELRGYPPTAEALDVLAQACHRVQLARRFHNDAVAQAQRVRRKRVVRWTRLAGRAAMPQMVEFDDSVPGGLVG